MKELIRDYGTMLLIAMLFLHIVDDFYLQGMLANLKQRRWWKENYPDPIYSGDYITALMLHAFSWSFLTMLPVAFCIIVTKSDSWAYVTMFLVNSLVHAFIDNMKANALKISLTTDQVLHMLQILVTWIITGFVCV